MLLLACPLIVGFVLAQALLQGGAGDPDPAKLGVFLYLFSRFEPINFILLLATGALIWALSLAGRATVAPKATAWATVGSWRSVAVLAFVALLIAGLGARFILHSYPLAMDEFVADFQARIFAGGQVRAPIPSEWAPFARALTPIFVFSSGGGDSWTSAYLPVAAAIRAIFVVAGAPDLTNPVLAGLTIPVIWLVGRRLWPGDRSTPWVATLLLAVAPQFLVTSMTAYAMPAHLLFNLVWLYLYLRGTRVALAAAPFVGVLALGLHQPHVHALFVAPFLIRLVLTRRWRIAIYFAIVYVLGLALWIGWFNVFTPSYNGLGGSFYSLPSLYQLLLQSMNLALLVSWQSIAMVLLAVVGLTQWRRMSATMRDIAFGVALTLGFYVFVGFDQGHGWGYSYALPVLGNLTLLAGHGWSALNEEWRRSRGSTFLAASVLIAVAVQLPIRAMQVESFVRPFSDANVFIRSLAVDVALVRDTDGWYARDLVRNDPWLASKPKVMFEGKLTDTEVAMLRSAGTVRVVGAPDFRQFGMRVREAQLASVGADLRNGDGGL